MGTTFEDKLRGLEAKRTLTPEDADLRVIAALFRSKLPAGGKNRREAIALRNWYRNKLEVMVELKRLGLLDVEP